jgi:PAS domain S-box-containing protein
MDDTSPEGFRARPHTEAWHAKETSHALLFAQHPSPMWVVDDATLAILEVNEAAVRHYGYPRAEFLRMTMQDLCPPTAVPSALAGAPWTPTAGHQGQVEQTGLSRHRRRDGTRMDVEIHSSTLVFHGRHAHLVMAYDVTERVRAEGALRASYAELDRRVQERTEALAQSNVALHAEVAERRRAEGEAEQRRREAEVLARLAQTMSASLELDTVLQRITEGARELCGSERALIMLRESGGEALVSRYQAGFPQMPYTGVRVEPGKGMGGWVLATGRPLRTADYAADARFSKDYLDRIRTDGRLAILTVPITIGSRVEGALYVSNAVARPFTERDEAILLRLADYASSAIRNAQLYHAAQAELTRRTQVEAQLQASLQEKEVLLQEIHHRVKNNLQIVSSLLNLQARAVDDPHLRAILRDSRQRLQAMALIHEDLYQAHDLGRVPFGTYVRQLTAQLFRAYGGAARRIRLTVHADALDLEIDKATPCGLILHELLANALTHAFHDGRSGAIEVALRRAAQNLTLSVKDTGIGMPDALGGHPPGALGLKLVAMLTNQLGGTVIFAQEGGTTFTLTVPLPPMRPQGE